MKQKDVWPFCIVPTCKSYQAISDFRTQSSSPLQKREGNCSGGSRGGARGDALPPLFLDQTEARRGEKYFFETALPSLSEGELEPKCVPQLILGSLL